MLDNKKMGRIQQRQADAVGNSAFPNGSQYDFLMEHDVKLAQLGSK